MIKAETKAELSVDLEVPPEGGNLSVIGALEDDAHYLRVTLDKSENFKVAAGEKLQELLVNKFGNNRNALRDWYEDNVTEGKAHRAWTTVATYLHVVVKYGPEAAPEIFAKREEKHRQEQRKYDERRYGIQLLRDENGNIINGVSGQIERVIKSEYDRRKEWLSDMNHLWFKADREWQDRWLQDRKLLRERSVSGRSTQ